MRINILGIFLLLISCQNNIEKKNDVLELDNSSHLRDYVTNLDLERSDEIYYFMQLSQSKINCECFSDAITFIKERHNNKFFIVSFSPQNGSNPKKIDSIAKIFSKFENIKFLVDKDSEYYKQGNYRSPMFSIMQGESILYSAKFDTKNYSDIYTNWAAIR